MQKARFDHFHLFSVCRIKIKEITKTQENSFFKVTLTLLWQLFGIDLLSVYCPSFQYQQLSHLEILLDNWSGCRVHSTQKVVLPVKNWKKWTLVLLINKYDKNALLCKKYNNTCRQAFFGLEKLVFWGLFLSWEASCYTNQNWINISAFSFISQIIVVRQAKVTIKILPPPPSKKKKI